MFHFPFTLAAFCSQSYLLISVYPRTDSSWVQSGVSLFFFHYCTFLALSLLTIFLPSSAAGCSLFLPFMHSWHTMLFQPNNFIV
ncbi:hypothetical protein DFS34DRAFT_633513 [Phlyctochytrium arcticum]|nr:hypothetical protein DFS34DRAFT_633513 [Phlyctochytrium arcticum]